MLLKSGKLRLKMDNDSAFCILYFICLIKDFILYGTTVTELFETGLLKTVTMSLHMLVILFGLYIIFVLNQVTRKELLEFSFLIMNGVLIYIRTRSADFFDLVFIIFSARYVNLNKILKEILIVQGTMTALIIALSYLGVISNIVDMANRIMGKRFGIGFTHPNRAGIIAFEIICLLMYCGKRRRLGKYFLSIIILLLIYFPTKARTAYYLSAAVIAMFFVKEFGKCLSVKTIKIIVKVGIFALFCSVILFILYLYQNQEKYYYSTLISRIKMATVYFKSYSVNLFGNDISSGTWTRLPGTDYGYYYLDNGLLNYLLSQGIIAFTWFVWNYKKTITKLINHKNWSYLIILISYAVYAMVETTPMSCVCNIFLIIFGYSILDRADQFKILK